MIEHMYKIMTMIDRRHGMSYGYLLKKVFDLFKVTCGKGLLGSIKQTFTITILIECRCVEGKVRTKWKIFPPELIL